MRNMQQCLVPTRWFCLRPNHLRSMPHQEQHNLVRVAACCTKSMIARRPNRSNQSHAVQGIDAYDMSDPVDILKDLAKFDEEVAKTEKWALRKAVLTRLKTLAKARHTNKGDRHVSEGVSAVQRNTVFLTSLQRRARPRLAGNHREL